MGAFNSKSQSIRNDAEGQVLPGLDAILAVDRSEGKDSQKSGHHSLKLVL
jgi:hypothetical protein